MALQSLSNIINRLAEFGVFPATNNQRQLIFTILFGRTAVPGRNCKNHQEITRNGFKRS